MGREYPTDTLWRAQELYCVDRLSYAAVAEATGVSPTTLKAWGQLYNWSRKRAEIAQAESEIRVNLVKGRQKALEQLLTAADAKEAAPMAFAVSSLESLALKRQELAAAGKIPSAAPVTRRKIGNRAEAIAALREAVERKLGLALADPDKISTATVQDVKRCLELVAELEASLPKENETEESRRRGLSQNMAESIYKALGVAEEA
ncbi:hypothetical protein [Desulfovibrio sp. ZJ200]|uniref:hypothetical protein n=1 Tax=Desulfovibrio sp. ZJ200 TaxID=2709792 RepID=UPI0013EDABF0|nr:hypothetical protein [Desulfovibrio sp. ZJ200]